MSAQRKPPTGDQLRDAIAIQRQVADEHGVQAWELIAADRQAALDLARACYAHRLRGNGWAWTEIAGRIGWCDGSTARRVVAGLEARLARPSNER